MTSDGVLLRSTAQGHWAWVGLRVTPVTGYDDVEAPRLRADLAVAERAWLSGLWSTANGIRWELRYLNERQHMPLTCVLLGRAHAGTAPEATAAALALRAGLAAAPRHVRTAPLTTDQVTAYLNPPRPAAAFELRKRLRWAWRQRPQPGHRVWFDIAPLEPNTLSWQPFWHELARLPAPTTVGVYLEPVRPAPGFFAGLRTLATTYAEAGAGGRTSSVWQVRIPGDPAAAAAAPGYAAAAGRYADRPFWLRVSVASAGPVEPGLVELLAATAGGAAACRAAPGDVDALWRNMAALNRDWLDDTYRQGAPPGELGETERNVSSLVDVTEALAAFRLPYETADRQPLFTAKDRPMPEPDPVVTAGPNRTKVFISYVREDVEQVDALADALRAAGYDVWIDHVSLRPGMRWKTVIRDAINDGHYFIACFSPRYWKLQSFMNEELIVAVERLRLMPRSRQWFIPVVLERTDLPDYAIGPNETLADLQYVDMSADWRAGVDAITTTLRPPA